MMTTPDQEPTQPSAEAQVEEPEAIGEPMPATEDYSVDQIKIRTEPRALVDVLRRIERGRFIMDPDFQRDFVWTDDKQSRLVESALMRIPLPVFYMAENLDGKLVVVDGLQRLTTFVRFHSGQLTLALPPDAEGSKSSLLGKTFSSLPPRLQNRFEDTVLTFYIIESGVPDRVRLDIFERVNGGAPLTRQQMRNCIYQGPATRLLKELAGSDEFKRATGGKVDSKSMRDRELVNRFIAFRLTDINRYNGDIDQHLAYALTEVNKHITVHDSLRAQFLASMKVCYEIFGERSFRRRQPSGRYSVINVALFDVLSVVFSEGDPQTWIRHREQIGERLHCMIAEDQDFFFSINNGTNGKRQVLTRFGKVREMLQEVLNADPA